MFSLDHAYSQSSNRGEHKKEIFQPCTHHGRRNKHKLTRGEVTDSSSILTEAEANVINVTESTIYTDMSQMQLSSSEYVALSSALQTKSIPILSTAVCACKHLKDAIIVSILKQLSNEVSKLKARIGNNVSVCIISSFTVFMCVLNMAELCVLV